MKIYDCFTFYNEEEILKIRLNELKDVVDYFFIVEADRTFTGKMKDSYLDKYNWLGEFSSKIIRCHVSLHDCTGDAWCAEYKQRNAIQDVVNYADDFDFCVISDVDEIPRPDILQSVRIDSEVNAPVQLDVDQYFWNFNWLTPKHCNEGARPVFCQVKDLKNSSPQDLRADSSMKKIPDAGWHFSFVMSPEDIINKIESFAHTEYDSQEYKDLNNILSRIQSGIDPFDRFPLKYEKISNKHPKYIQENYKDG